MRGNESAAVEVYVLKMQLYTTTKNMPAETAPFLLGLTG